MSSRKRQADLETLMDFVQSATNELMWLSEKEEREITRDWSSKSLNLVEVEQYYQVLLSLHQIKFFTAHLIWLLTATKIFSAIFFTRQCLFTVLYNFTSMLLVS
jgi:hypothetical protein